MIWLLSAVNAAVLLIVIFGAFAGWRLFWAWRDVHRERREEQERERGGGGTP